MYFLDPNNEYVHDYWFGTGKKHINVKRSDRSIRHAVVPLYLEAGRDSPGGRKSRFRSYSAGLGLKTDGLEFEGNS